MSWWDTDRGDVLIGDGPADLMSAALSELARESERAFGHKPSLPELLDGLGKVTTPSGAAFARTGGGTIWPIEPPIPAETEHLHGALALAAEQIALLYQERWERDPTPAELGAVMAFVLRAEPERFVRDGDGLDLDTIAVGALRTEAPH